MKNENFERVETSVAIFGQDDVWCSKYSIERYFDWTKAKGMRGVWFRVRNNGGYGYLLDVAIKKSSPHINDDASDFADRLVCCGGLDGNIRIENGDYSVVNYTNIPPQYRNQLSRRETWEWFYVWPEEHAELYAYLAERTEYAAESGSPILVYDDREDFNKLKTRVEREQDDERRRAEHEQSLQWMREDILREIESSKTTDTKISISPS